MTEHLPNTVHGVINAGYRIHLSCHRCGYAEELLRDAALSARDSMFDYHAWPCPTCERASARAALTPPPRELTDEQKERKAYLELALGRAETIGERAKILTELSPLRPTYVPNQAKVFREDVRDREQILDNLIARTGWRAGVSPDEHLSVTVRDLGLLIDYARAGDQARWNRLNNVPELSPREILEDAIALGLNLKIQSSELLAMAGQNSQKRERMRFAVAKKLAGYLEDGFVFGQKMRRR